MTVAYQTKGTALLTEEFFTLTPEQKHAYPLHNFQNEPFAFFDTYCPDYATSPYPGERTALRALANGQNVAIELPPGSGKTMFAATIAFWWMLTGRHTRLTAPTEQQRQRLKNIVAEHLDYSRFTGEVTKNDIRFPTTAGSCSIMPTMPEALSGSRSYVIVDEAAAIDRVFLDRLIATVQAPVLLIGSRGDYPKNAFTAMFARLRPTTYPNWVMIDG